MFASFKSSTTPAEIENLYNLDQTGYAKKNYREDLFISNNLLKISSQHELVGIKGKVEVLKKHSQKAYNQLGFQLAKSYAREICEPNQKSKPLTLLAQLCHQIYCLTKTAMPHFEIDSSTLVDNLVFQRSGIKELAYTRACEMLSQYINFSEVKCVDDTSAGAIQVLLLALDYSVPEFMELMKKMDFNLFMDGAYRSSLFRVQEQLQDKNTQGSSIIKASRWAHTVKALKEGVGLLKQQKFGLFPGEYFKEEWAELLIQRKTGILNLTFRELQALKPEHPFKDLYVVGVNLNKSQAAVFSRETTLDVIISDALRISMSIPLIFKPHSVYLKQNGRQAIHPEKNGYVGEEILDNYLLWLFDRTCYLKEGLCQSNPYTVGLKLVDKNNLESLSEHPNSLGSYVLLIVKIIQKKQNSNHLKLGDDFRAIEIDSLGVGATHFNLEEVEQKRLVDSGKEAVHAHFKQRHIN